MDNEEHVTLQGSGGRVVCPHEVKGASAFCPLANIKFLRQQDSGTYCKEHHQTIIQEEEISLSYMYECQGNNMKAENLFH